MDKNLGNEKSAVGMPMAILCCLVFGFGMIFIHIPRLLFRNIKKECVRLMSTSNELKLLEHLEESASKYAVHLIKSSDAPYTMIDGHLTKTIETELVLAEARNKSLARCKEARIAEWKINSFL